VLTAGLFWPRPTPIPAEIRPTERLLAASADLDDIVIEAIFHPNSRSLNVAQTLTLRNRSSQPLHAVILRAYANAFQSEDTSPIAVEELYDRCYPSGFSQGGLYVSSVKTGLGNEPLRQAAYHYLDGAKTIMCLNLPAAWLPGETLAIEAEYILHLPNAANRFGMNNGIFAIGNGFLSPAILDGIEYRMDPYYPVGDPFFSACANYLVSVTVPAGYACAGSAWPSMEDDGAGALCYRFNAPAARDFALCLSNEYIHEQAMEGDILVTVFAKDKGHAARALRFAKQALRCFNARYGMYPYPAFTLAEADFPFGGMEYPCFAMIGTAEMVEGGDRLELAIAHETAHQWWYAVVGNDPVFQAWQDEALCEFSLLAYAETYYGKPFREDLLFRRMETAMRVTVPRGVSPGSPLSDFSGMNEYTLVVYGRGGAMLVALDEALDGKLDAFLRAYYDNYRFSIASREDFECLLRSFSDGDWFPLITDYLDTHLP